MKGDINLSKYPLMSGVILFFAFISSAIAVESKIVVQRTIITATVVASSCKIIVDADSVGNNKMSFGIYDKNTKLDVNEKIFTVWFYELGTTLPGCSAFLTSPNTQFSFGNPGQLDTAGVITQGAGGEVRIMVKPLDKEADYKGSININNSQVSYRSDFTSHGKVQFVAKPINLEKASGGEYNGKLSFVVSYN
ncbi:fimbrial protein [Salmonella enterica]|nr:fimbrial protein [Salmonella enterica]